MTNSEIDLGLEALENRVAELVTEATPIIKEEDESTSTGAALFGQIVDGHVELRDNQPSRKDRESAAAKGNPYCRFLLTHQFREDKGDHVVIVGANPSIARSFTGSQSKTAEYPQSDPTAHKIFEWVDDHIYDKASTNIQRLSIINIFPLIHSKQKNAVELLTNVGSSLVKGINTSIFNGLRNFSGGDTHFVLAHGELDELEFYLRSILTAHMIDRIFEAATDPEETVWKCDVGKATGYPPHPLYHYEGRRVIGLLPYPCM